MFQPYIGFFGNYRCITHDSIPKFLLDTVSYPLVGAAAALLGAHVVFVRHIARKICCIKIYTAAVIVRFYCFGKLVGHFL